MRVLNRGRESNITNTFVTGVLLMLIGVCGVYLSTLVTNTMKTSNYNKVIMEEARIGNFRPILGTSRYYYELDRIENDNAPDFALYGQYYGDDESYYSFIFYDLNKIDSEAGIGHVQFSCNENSVVRSFNKRSDQVYVSVMFSEEELIEECNTETLNISNIEYKLDDSRILSIDSEYTLDLDKAFYVSSGIEGFSDDEFEDMIEGTNITIFRVIFYPLFSALVIYMGYRSFRNAQQPEDYC